MNSEISGKSDDLFLSKIRENSDIFISEKSHLLQGVISITTLAGVALGAYLTLVDLYQLHGELINGGPHLRVTIAPEVNIREPEPVVVVKKPKVVPKKVSPTAHTSGKANSGAGTLRSRVSQKGVLGLLKSSSGAQIGDNPLARGGFASGIDKVLQGVSGGLKKGDGGPKRVGTVEFVGNGSGTQSGFGDGDNTGDVLSLIASLSGSGSAIDLQKKRRTLEKIEQPDGANSEALVGKRSRRDIMRVVNQNTQSLRYLFNRHLRNVPNMKGKVTLKWAIDEFGNVIFCRVVSTTVENSAFEREIVTAVKRWKFSRIHITGDVTEVVYPFVFTQ
jgi:TonB family protein